MNHVSTCNINALLSTTKNNWKMMPLLDRARAVVRLRPDYRSNRDLAEALNRDEGTIRRMLRIAALETGDQALIAQGQSAEEVFRAARQRQIEREIERQLEQQKSTERLIEDKVRLVLDWLKQIDLSRPYAEEVIHEIDRRLFTLERVLHKQVPLADPAIDAWEVIASLRPQRQPEEIDDLLWSEYFICWGLRWIPRLVPHAIRYDVLQRVKKAIPRW